MKKMQQDSKKENHENKKIDERIKIFLVILLKFNL